MSISNITGFGKMEENGGSGSKIYLNYFKFTKNGYYCQISFLSNVNLINYPSDDKLANLCSYVNRKGVVNNNSVVYPVSGTCFYSGNGVGGASELEFQRNNGYLYLHCKTISNNTPAETSLQIDVNYSLDSIEL